jgi:hypothetical protein
MPCLFTDAAEQVNGPVDGVWLAVHVRFTTGVADVEVWSCGNACFRAGVGVEGKSVPARFGAGVGVDRESGGCGLLTIWRFALEPLKRNCNVSEGWHLLWQFDMSVEVSRCGESLLPETDTNRQL